MRRRAPFLAGVLLVLIGVQPSTSAATTTSQSRNQFIETGKIASDHLTPQLLQKILEATLQEWTQYNYGTLRSAYNLGTLQITPTSHPSGVPAYIVDYDGLEICVLISI